MKRILIISSIALLLLVGVFFKLRSNQEVAQGRIYVHDASTKASIKTEKVELQPMSEKELLIGTFQANKEVSLMPQTQGEIVYLNFAEGGYVRAGQVLVKVDKEALEAQLIGAEASYLSAQKDVDRYQQAVAGDALPEMQLDKSKLQLAMAESQLKLLNKQLENTVITSPLSGFVTRKLVEQGSVIAPGAPIAVITDVGRLKLMINVPEQQLNQFKEGAKVKVMAEAAPGEEFTGVIDYIGVKGDAAHNFPVSIRVNNEKGLLRAGMFGTLVHQPNDNTPLMALAIPRKALVGSQEDPRVFVVKGDLAMERSVRLGAESRDFIEVLGGVKRGETVVVSGQVNLSDSTLISVLN